MECDERRESESGGNFGPFLLVYLREVYNKRCQVQLKGLCAARGVMYKKFVRYNKRCQVQQKVSGTTTGVRYDKMCQVQ